MAPLTFRQTEVLALASNGFTNNEIARLLFLSPETVKTHMRAALAALEASSRTHAVAIALRAGLIR